MAAALPIPSDPRLAEAVAVIVDRLPGVAAIYLYGSCARGDARPDSDVDLAVFTAGAPVSAMDLWETRLDLSAALRLPVDLVHLDAVSTVLQKEVVTDGRRLHAAHPHAADLFELRTLREYADLVKRREGLDADIVAHGHVLARA